MELAFINTGNTLSNRESEMDFVDISYDIFKDKKDPNDHNRRATMEMTFVDEVV
jgi:hypothetical protein